MDRPGPKKLFLYILVASVAASALIGIVVVLFGNFGEFETKVLLTALTVTVTSIMGLACGAFLETGRGRIIPIAGIGFALASAVMWIYLIWAPFTNNDYFVKSLMSATLLAASCSHLSLLSLARLDRRFAWARWATHASVWALTALLFWLIWTIVDEPSEFVQRAIGVLSILLGALTVITPVLHWLSTKELDVKEIDEEIARLRSRIEDLEQKRQESEINSRQADRQG